MLLTLYFSQGISCVSATPILIKDSNIFPCFYFIRLLLVHCRNAWDSLTEIQCQRQLLRITPAGYSKIPSLKVKPTSWEKQGMSWLTSSSSVACLHMNHLIAIRPKYNAHNIAIRPKYNTHNMNCEIWSSYFIISKPKTQSYLKLDLGLKCKAPI